MKKNDERIGIVSAIGSNGEGIIKDEGIVVFVPFTLIGEKVRYKILKANSKIAYAKALEIIIPAEIRIRSKCPVFTKCGGCQLQHVKYLCQIKIKEENVVNCFKKIAGLDVKLLPTIKGDNEFRYRNKLQLPVRQGDDGVLIGFYAENSHRVVPINDCPINAEWTKNLIEAFREYFSTYSITGYNEENGTGEIREITAREIKDKLIITVVSNSEKIRHVDSLIDILKAKMSYEFSLFKNVNKSRSNVIYGDDFELIYGKGEYQSDMLGIKYKVGVRSFMQVNTTVCQKLYSAVSSLVCADEDTTVIDAYSGAGLMTAMLAKKAKKAIGIEIIPEAVRLANELALKNGLENKVSNYQGKCELIMPDIIEKEKTNNQKIAIVLDPPRKGCDYSVIQAVQKSQADKIVYVSCMPSTLARDVGLIVGTLEVKEGQIVKVEKPICKYEVSSIRTFDMFPQTKHVETVVCLKRI